MSKQPKSHPSHGEGPSRHQGPEQHGWAPDVNATHQEENPSARRSFHTEEHTPASPQRSSRSAGDRKADEGTPVKSDSRSGEERSGKSGGKGHHDLGPRGRAQRPSGGKDADAYTGVDPKHPSERHRRG